MKVIKLLSTFAVLILSSCSNNDEPEPPYTGPWEIVYIEEYYGMHNDDPKFATWFNEHTHAFTYGDILWYNGTMETFTALAPNETYDTFKECYGHKVGRFMWEEVVTNATEQEMEAKVKEFESFTIENERDKTGDIFRSQYHRQNE